MVNADDENMGGARKIALDRSSDHIKVKITYPGFSRAISTTPSQLNTILSRLMAQKFILVDERGSAITNRYEYLKSNPRHFEFKSKHEFIKGNSQSINIAGSNIRTTRPTESIRGPKRARRDEGEISSEVNPNSLNRGYGIQQAMRMPAVAGLPSSTTYTPEDYEEIL
jgi:hypothetical protein